jgi:hypothetical protein
MGQASGPARTPDSPTSQRPTLRDLVFLLGQRSRNLNASESAHKKQKGPEILKSLSQIFDENRFR